MSESTDTLLGVFNSALTNASNHTNSDKPRRQDILLGCAVAIGGNLLISVSLNLQKYTHVENLASADGKHYLCRPIWWLGLLLMGLGEVGNFAAYGFAPASLVAPLGTTAVIANLFIAAIFLKERIRPEDIFGSALAIVGALLLVLFSPKGELVLPAAEIWTRITQTSFLIYVGVEVVALVVLFVIKYKWMKNVVVLLLIANLLASFTVISAKAMSGMLQLTIAGEMQLQQAVFWVFLAVMVCTCVTQIKFLNQAMQSFDSTVVVPINFVFFTISAIIAGIVFYWEFSGMTALAICMFLFGCLLCFVGVYFISAGRVNGASPGREKSDLKAEEKVHSDAFPSRLFSSVTRAVAPSSTSPASQDEGGPRAPQCGGDSDSLESTPVQSSSHSSGQHEPVNQAGNSTPHHPTYRSMDSR